MRTAQRTRWARAIALLAGGLPLMVSLACSDEEVQGEPVVARVGTRCHNDLARPEVKLPYCKESRSDGSVRYNGTMACSEDGQLWLGCCDGWWVALARCAAGCEVRCNEAFSEHLTLRCDTVDGVSGPFGCSYPNGTTRNPETPPGIMEQPDGDYFCRVGTRECGSSVPGGQEVYECRLDLPRSGTVIAPNGEICPYGCEQGYQEGATWWDSGRTAKCLDTPPPCNGGPPCPAGEVCCEDGCFNLFAKDNKHCGSCGNVCSGGSECQEKGVCACNDDCSEGKPCCTWRSGADGDLRPAPCVAGKCVYE